MAHYGRGKPAEMFNLPGLILVYKNSPKIFFDRGLHLRSAFKVVVHAPLPSFGKGIRMDRSSDPPLYPNSSVDRNRPRI